MNITKRIDRIVKDISKTDQGGNVFFDKLDSEIKKSENIDIIVKLFEKIYSDFGLNYNLVVSGGFGDLIMFLLKRGDIKCKGSILQVSGGLTSHFNDMDKIKKVKDVLIQKQVGDIHQRDFIFVDDSFYSGTTGFSIDVFLKKIGSKILKTYVVYDGNDNKSKNRTSLYNYYDWNVGSKRSVDELMSELNKYSNIPKNIFEEKILKGEIKSIIQLRKLINEFKIKSGESGIDVYTRTRESIILKFDNFNESNNSELYFRHGWEELNPQDEGLVAVKMWRYKLRDDFNCLVLLRKNQVSSNLDFIVYLQDPNGVLNFMDYVENPMIFKNLQTNGSKFAIEICEKQLYYYNNLSKLPKEEEVKNCLYIFLDEEFELQSPIKYGYASKIEKSHEYELVSYYAISKWTDFICAFILGGNTSNRHLYQRMDEISKLIKEFELLLNFEYDYNIKVSYLLDTRGLVIILKNK